MNEIKKIGNQSTPIYLGDQVLLLEVGTIVECVKYGEDTAHYDIGTILMITDENKLVDLSTGGHWGSDLDDYGFEIIHESLQIN